MLRTRIRSLAVAISWCALSSAAPAFAELAHHVEEEWLVAQIASTIAGAPVTASRLPQSGPGPVSTELFDLIMPDGRHEKLELAGQLWAPGNFVALARQAGAAAVADTGAPPPNELLAALTTPHIEVLLDANRSTSRRLAAGERGAHDDAALLLAAFALREAAGRFSDTRPAMCAITAHLAIARARGDAPGRNARAAEITLLVLAGLEHDATEQLDEWEAASAKNSAERSWIAALRLRATGDWRLLKEPAHASLLERLAYVRAVSERLNTNRAMDFLDESHPEDVADWTRLITGGRMSVQTGNTLASPAIAMEIEEARLAWSALHPAAPALRLDALVDALNETASPAGAAAAIPWPMFAASYQRHLAMALAAAVRHTDYMLGLKEEARELARIAQEGFGRLTLYPLAMRYYAIDEAQYWQAMKQAAPLWQEHPEVITSANWTMLSERWSSARVPDNVPPAPRWFQPLVPLGTAYDARHRIYTVRRSLIMQPADLDRLRKLAPSESAVLFELPRFRPAGKPPLARLRAEAGALAEYDLSVLHRLALAAEPDVDAYRKIGRTLCDLEANECSTLAAYLADRDLDEEAARTYQEFADRARDLVGMSREIDWLVFYYEQHGQGARATELADRAADVHSYAGLATKASLLELRGRLDDAEKLFRTAVERYSRGPGDLAAFYLRRATGATAARYRELAEPLVETVFPAGFQRTGDALPVGAPQAGVRLRQTGARGAAAGFKEGDIVVAVDGVTVTTRNQMTLVWRMSRAADITFVVWRGDRYETIRGPLRFTWVSGSFADYDYRWPILS